MHGVGFGCRRKHEIVEKTWVGILIVVVRLSRFVGQAGGTVGPRHRGFAHTGAVAVAPGAGAGASAAGGVGTGTGIGAPWRPPQPRIGSCSLRLGDGDGRRVLVCPPRQTVDALDFVALTSSTSRLLLATPHFGLVARVARSS